MQKTPLASIAARVRLERSMQTRTVGGASETEATAVAVRPNRPCAPRVVTTWTALATCAMASRKACPGGGSATGGKGWTIRVIGSVARAAAEKSQLPPM